MGIWVLEGLACEFGKCEKGVGIKIVEFDRNDAQTGMKRKCVLKGSGLKWEVFALKRLTQKGWGVWDEKERSQE